MHTAAAGCAAGCLQLLAAPACFCPCPASPRLRAPRPPARAACAAYHHGEASLGGTIVGLAQDFVGSNNINYLVPQGAPTS